MNPANCPNVLAEGTCSDPVCQYAHNIPTCEHCSHVFATESEYEVHLTTAQHKSRVAGTSFAQHCSICKTNVLGGEKVWRAHLTGKKHCAKALRMGVSPNIAPQGPTATTASEFCDLCQCIVQKQHWNSHIKGQKHQSRQMFTRYRNAIEESESDKNGISVTGTFDFNLVEPAAAAAGVRTTVTITTSVPYSNCVLQEFRLASSHGRRIGVPAFSVALDGTTTAVKANSPVKLVITLKVPHIGRYEDRLEFTFRDTQLRKTFIITRTLKAIIGNRADHEALRPRAPYVPRTRSTRYDIKETIPGVKPPALQTIRFVVQLPHADIPQRLKALLSGSEGRKAILNNVKKLFLPQELNTKTYASQFKYLLWIEEAKMEEDLERYDILNASLTRHNKYYYLDVPGLAEKRPSVLVGDRILVQERGATNGRWFEGHVHFVRQAEVGLCFHSTFSQHPDGHRFHVRFKLNRIPLRRQHQAMDHVFTEDRILFPEDIHLPKRPSRVALKLFNGLLSSNEPQLQAVASILSSPAGSPPFVVFGPPGTGKTITIIEAIRQVIAEVPQARILACAPSNSAADLIALRLGSALTPSQLFRFYAPSRSKAQVSDTLLSYTHEVDGHFSAPHVSRLKRYNVIVSTCVSASFAAGVGMPRGHFTHIFIDEAGQATEPEAFVSIKMLADIRTNVILSGDPKQLGPIIRSPIARELGLEMSYLERLMSRDAYSLKTSYGRVVIKLTKNFRSHNAILSFPNERFYDNDLKPCADPKIMNRYLNSSYLPAKKFPIVFHSVSGKDDREASSPSFFNIDEVLQVKSYVQQLKSDRAFRTTDADIGIIAPYHAQCLKLRSALRSVAESVKIGSVEEFQGQERPVIIISTVRSSKEFVEYDLRHTLGFVANPRRFNVAVTRTQSLLIIVGDPQVLSLDPLWRSFLNYIYLKGGWTGPDITWDPKEPVDEKGGYDKKIRSAAEIDMNEFARRMEACTIAEVEDDLDANVDRPWRNVE
ncbi:RNA helicase [Pholiota conissans]|uniref:RNA helicase n=1 Tax=Pholiota conissans TaxID=109636 RepID=A0A9P5ZD97_9AGAR|nr:RNA helicase [Pholiota conissans]